MTMDYDRDGFDDDPVCCDICDRPMRRLTYRGATGTLAPAWLCEECEADEAAAENAAADVASLEASAAQDDGPVADLIALYQIDPFVDHTKQGLFRYHRCWACDDGAKPCVEGKATHCSMPRARND